MRSEPRRLRALIWDVDGTVAETEAEGHRLAFNAAFADLGLPWRWDLAHYSRLLEVSGGRERILHDMASRAGVPARADERESLARELHRRKNAFYAALVAEGGIAARPGVVRLVQECEGAGVALAVATTTSRSNVLALFPGLFGAAWASRFTAVLCAEDAPLKKPHPQVYLRTLERLGVPAEAAMAVEDSPNGLAAARAAGVAVCITRSVFFAGASFDGAALVCDDLDAPPRVDLARLDDALGAAPGAALSRAAQAAP